MERTGLRGTCLGRAFIALLAGIKQNWISLFNLGHASHIILRLIPGQYGDDPNHRANAQLIPTGDKLAIQRVTIDYPSSLAIPEFDQEGSAPIPFYGDAYQDDDEVPKLTIQNLKPFTEIPGQRVVPAEQKALSGPQCDALIPVIVTVNYIDKDSTAHKSVALYRLRVFAEARRIPGLTINSDGWSARAEFLYFDRALSASTNPKRFDLDRIFDRSKLDCHWYYPP